MIHTYTVIDTDAIAEYREATGDDFATCGNCDTVFSLTMMQSPETCLCCYCAGQEHVGAECVCDPTPECCAKVAENDPTLCASG